MSLTPRETFALTAFAVLAAGSVCYIYKDMIVDIFKIVSKATVELAARTAKRPRGAPAKSNEIAQGIRPK